MAKKKDSPAVIKLIANQLKPLHRVLKVATPVNVYTTH